MIVITGQTATGKTKLALELAQKHNGELVNFDSRQFYKGLDIITGKDIPKNSEFEIQFLDKLRIDPKRSQTGQSSKKDFCIGYYRLSTSHQSPIIKLWLYDIITPDRYFSSYGFSLLAQSVIADITKRGKTPILVGGSYFYLKHLLYGLDIPSIPADPKLRKRLKEKSVPELQKLLSQLNVGLIDQLNNSDKNNPHRLMRKIEIALAKKKSRPIHRPGVLRPKMFVGLKYEQKKDLVKAINIRIQKRLTLGAIEEVKSLLNQRYQPSDPGMKTIGYQQIIAFLQGKTTREKAIEEWTTREVQYAKRQLTFMKKDKNIKWREIR